MKQNRKRKMLLEPKRNPRTTYRLATLDDGLYHLTVYPKTPAPIHTAHYRMDMLPEWMQNCLRLLDAAGGGHSVEGVGRKVDSTYWIEPIEAVSPPDDSSWTLLIEAQKVLDRGLYTR